MSPKSPISGDLEDKTICFCHSVSLGELRKAYENGARSLREIQHATLASTGCGGCEVDVLDVLEALEAVPENELA